MTLEVVKIEKNKLKIVKIDDTEIDDTSTVKVSRCNHVIDVTYSYQSNSEIFNKTRRIDAERYVNLETGEIFYYKTSDHKSNINSLRATFKKLRLIINANFSGGNNELWVTLTYAENMQDEKRLYTDFKDFIKRLRYKYGKLEYISVIEPQKRGAWHMHVLIKSLDADKLYIPNKQLAEIWGHGFTKTNRLADIDNIGAYLSAYLTNMPKSEFGYSEEDIEKSGKKYIKGMRMKFYKSHTNIYRCSRGINLPITEEMTFKEIKEKAGLPQPTFSSALLIQLVPDDESADNTFLNRVVYHQYNLLRE